MASDTQRNRLILVSGVSGAGKSSALRQLEDLGYEAIDNVPLSLVGRLVFGADGTVDAHATARPLAIGIDVRTRDFEPSRLIEVIEQLRALPDIDAHLLFLDCDDQVLGRRFEETRRRHPLAADRPVGDGIRLERIAMGPVREAADTVIDTSDFILGDLKMRLELTFPLEDDPGLAIFVMSFSFKRGIPRDADLVFDVRFLKNPHYDPILRPLTGEAADVQAFVSADPAFDGFFANLTAMLQPLLPRYRAEGKSYLTVAFGCTGGRHRSVFLAERLARVFGDNGWPAQIRHRDLDKA